MTTNPSPRRSWTRSILNFFLSSAVVLVLLTITGQLSPACAAAGTDVVARVGGQDISLAELEDFAAPQLNELAQQRQRILEEGLNRLIEERLLEIGADAQGKSAESFIESQITSKIQPVTDADVDSWYEANQARVRQPKEQVADQIRSFLEHQRSQVIRQDVLTLLKKEHAVDIRLEPLRFDIDVDGAASKGPASAPVTLVEYSDFQCPACKRVVPAIHELSERYGDRLQVVFKQFPLHSIHPQAQKAAEASLCARDQGKFWTFHDTLFDKQQELAVDQLKAHAASLGLDTREFNSCLDSGQYEDRVLADVETGRMIGVGGTPTLFINGRPVTLLRGRETVDQLADVVEDELRRAGAAGR